MSASPVSVAFCEYAARKLNDHLAQIRRCVNLLSEEQVWFRPNERSNSVANLLLHLTGNVRQWILGGLAGRPVQRQRQAEFDQRGGVGKAELLPPLEMAVAEANAAIGAASDDALAREYAIQGYNVSGVAVVLHVVEHFAFHTGQIVTTTKWLLDVDLSLYDEHGRRRDGRTEGTP